MNVKHGGERYSDDDGGAWSLENHWDAHEVASTNSPDVKNAGNAALRCV